MPGVADCCEQRVIKSSGFIIFTGSNLKACNKVKVKGLIVLLFISADTFDVRAELFLALIT